MIPCPRGTTVPYPYVHEIGKLLLANSLAVSSFAPNSWVPCTPKTVLYRTGSTASAKAGVSHSACRRSGCQHRVGHSHGTLDCDSKTVRDRPPFSLHVHLIS